MSEEYEADLLKRVIELKRSEIGNYTNWIIKVNETQIPDYVSYRVHFSTEYGMRSMDVWPTVNVVVDMNGKSWNCMERISGP